MLELAYKQAELNLQAFWWCFGYQPTTKQFNLAEELERTCPCYPKDNLERLNNAMGNR